MAENNAGGLEVPLLPFEGDETSAQVAEDRLADLLTDDGDIAEPGTQDADEPESDEAEEDAADDEQPDEEDAEGDEPEEEPEDGEESDEDEDGDEEERESDEDDPESPEKQGLRLADYTRKTQALAEQRKQLETTLAETSKARDEYAELLEQAKAFVESTGPKRRTAAEWDTLKQQDPAKFATEFAEWQLHQQDMQQLEAEQARVQQEQAKEQTERLTALLASEKQKLYEAIPEWQDDEVAAEEKAALKKYAADVYGWTEEDLSQVVDHRLMVILRKAQKYDAMTTKGKEKLDEKRTTAPVLKPGGKSPKPASKAKKLRARRERLARTGSVDDAAAVLMGMIDD